MNRNDLNGYNIHYYNSRGQTCRDYFDAATMLDAVCMFYKLRQGTDVKIYKVREF